MKRVLSLLLVVCLCFGMIAGCGRNDKKGKDNSISEAESVKEATINGCTFEVPTSWEDGDNTSDILYFYPEDGMLMVAYSDMNGTIEDKSTRDDFINSFGASMENYELLKETEISIAGVKAYKHDMKIELAEEKWDASMVTFDCDGGVISFLMSTLEGAKENYDKKLNSILDSVKIERGPASEGDNVEEMPDVEEVKKQVEVKAVPTLDGLMCVFIKNNSNTVIDELDVQLIFKDESGTTIDTDEDGHDMVLPGSTVVSRMEAPESYTEYEIVTSVELGVNPKYENHSADVDVNSNQGDDCIIVEITNNSGVSIDEVEYIAVLYKGDQIVTVEYPEDVMDVPAGQTITEKINTYDEEYDRFEVYLNQAHTFGF